MPDKYQMPPQHHFRTHTSENETENSIGDGLGKKVIPSRRSPEP